MSPRHASSAVSCGIPVAVECGHRFSYDLRTAPTAAGRPLHADSVQADLAELADEAFTHGILSEALPGDATRARVAFRPVFGEAPLLGAIEVEIEVAAPSGRAIHSQRFAHGPWLRSGAAIAADLRQAGRLAEDESSFTLLCAEPAAGMSPTVVLQPPVIRDASLDELGVRTLGDEAIEPDRPLLVSQRMEQEVIEWTERAGAAETGGATLGALVRLLQPLPGATTRVVTVLTASLVDERHDGAVGSLAFAPAALAEAARVAELRGRGEVVLTAFHTHGWGCGDCNQASNCYLPTCEDVSVDDYRVLATMLPSKATPMPIAGRRCGAPGRRPVLAVHAWRGGRVQPICWQRYSE